MSSKDLLVGFALTLASVAGGIAIGWMDTHNDEASVTVAALLAFSFLLGSLGPRRAWLWALLIGIWMPLLSYVLPPLGLAPVNPGMPRTVPSYLALTAVVMAACFAGAYAGSWLGRVARRASQSSVSAKG